MSEASKEDETVVIGFSHGIDAFLTERSVGRDFSNLSDVYKAIREETKKGDPVAVEMTPWGLEEFRICGKILRNGIPEGFSLPPEMPVSYKRNVNAFIEHYKKFGRKSTVKTIEGSTLFFISLTRFLDLRGNEILPIDRKARRKAFIPIMLDHASYQRRIETEKNEKRKEQLRKEHRRLLGKAFYPSLILGNIGMAGRINSFSRKGKKPKAVLVGGGHVIHLVRELEKIAISARGRQSNIGKSAEGWQKTFLELEKCALEYATERRNEKEARKKTSVKTNKKTKRVFLSTRRL